MNDIGATEEKEKRKKLSQRGALPVEELLRTSARAAARCRRRSRRSGTRWASCAALSSPPRWRRRCAHPTCPSAPLPPAPHASDPLQVVVKLPFLLWNFKIGAQQKRNTKIWAHDEYELAKEGDIVRCPTLRTIPARHHSSA